MSIVRPHMAISEAMQPLEKAIQQGTISGAAVAVGRGGEILHEWSLGRAFLDPAADVAPDTLFDVGTLTQALATASLFIALASEHRLNLNVFAAKYWPEFSEEGKEKVSLRHLLKHTSGLPADRPYFQELALQHPDWIGTERGKEFILGRLSSEPLEYPPTYALVQSNLGYLALGHIAECIAGEPLSALFHRIVAGPLGLSSAQFRLPPELRSRAAAAGFCPHRHRTLRGEVADSNAWAMGGVAGHAGIFIAAADAVRIGMGLAASLRREGGWLPSQMVSEFIGPKAKYKMGWEPPERPIPACGGRFSANTVGHKSRTGHSLWIDLDDETAIAVFAVFSPGEGHIELARTRPFEELLPPLHDAIREQIG